MEKFAKQYEFEVGDYRDNILDTLPSKTELERMQKANEEEKARMAAELKAREEAEAKRIEAERKRKEEEEETAKKKMQQEAAEVGNLFGQQAIVTPAGYQPKTSVKETSCVPRCAKCSRCLVSLVVKGGTIPVCRRPFQGVQETDYLLRETRKRQKTTPNLSVQHLSLTRTKLKQK